MQRRWTAVAVGCAITLLAPAAGAQRMGEPGTTLGDPLGFYVHGHVEGTRISPEEGEDDNGYGAGAQVGYNFTRYFGLFLGVDYARISVDEELEDLLAGTPSFSHVEVGGRVSFANSSTVTPYLDAGYARRTYDVGEVDLSDPEFGTLRLDLRGTGDNFFAGGGVQWFFRPALAFDAGVRLSFGELEADASCEGTLCDEFAGGIGATGEGASATFSRLMAGLTWYPGRGPESR